MVNQMLRDEICELEEIVAKLITNEENAFVVKKLQIEIDRLKGKLYYDERQSISLGGEIPSEDNQRHNPTS